MVKKLTPRRVPGGACASGFSPDIARIRSPLPRISLDRLGVPFDVPGTIFLRSEDAAYVTGTEISVNGGQHIY